MLRPMWREPGPGDNLSRETDDLIWVGDKWVYGYNRGRHQLRRIHRWEKDRTDVVRALVLPQSSLALAKVFYERLGRVWPLLLSCCFLFLFSLFFLLWFCCV